MQARGKQRTFCLDARCPAIATADNRDMTMISLASPKKPTPSQDFPLIILNELHFAESSDGTFVQMVHHWPSSLNRRVLQRGVL